MPQSQYGEASGLSEPFSSTRLKPQSPCGWFGMGKSRLETTSTPRLSSSPIGSSLTHDQARLTRASGLVRAAPRAKAFMLAGTPYIGLLATYPMRSFLVIAPAIAPVMNLPS